MLSVCVTIPRCSLFLWCLNQCFQRHTVYSKPLQSLNLSVPTFNPQGVNTLSPSACIMLYLYMTHCLEECTSPRGNAYVEGLTSDPKQRQGFFVMGDKPSASLAELSTYVDRRTRSPLKDALMHSQSRRSFYATVAASSAPAVVVASSHPITAHLPLS